MRPASFLGIKRQSTCGPTEMRELDIWRRPHSVYLSYRILPYLFYVPTSSSLVWFAIIINNIDTKFRLLANWIAFHPITHYYILNSSFCVRAAFFSIELTKISPKEKRYEWKKWETIFGYISLSRWIGRHNFNTLLATASLIFLCIILFRLII